MNPINGFKKGISGNPSGRPKAAQDWLEKELLPSLEKMKEKRDNAKDEKLQADMANKLVDKVLGTAEIDKQVIIRVDNHIHLPDGYKINS
jgi:hypothetical protein